MKWAKTIGLLILAIATTVSAVCEDSSSYERNLEAQLQKSLFCEYDADDRPVKDHKRGSKVRMGINVNKIETSEESWFRGNQVTIHGLTVMTWVDEYLQWMHIPKYKEISKIIVPIYKIWVPNIVFLNEESRQSTRDFDTYCMVLSDGTVACGAFTSFTVNCETDFKRWPYDSMNCTIRLKAWMKSGEVLNLDLLGNDDVYESAQNEMNKRHHYWKLQSTTATYTPQNIKPINISFPTINYSYILVRQTATWATLIFGPVLSMILMTIISYILEVWSLERLSILGVSLLCHFCYLLQLSWYIPSTGGTCPYILFFLRASMIMTAVSIVETLALRFMEGCTSNSVDYLLALLEKTTGTLLTFRGFQKMDSETEDDEDGNKSIKKKWRIFSVFLNRLFLIIISVAYFVTFLVTIL